MFNFLFKLNSVSKGLFFFFPHLAKKKKNVTSLENIVIFHELNYLKHPDYKHLLPNKTWRLKKKISLQIFCAVVIVKAKEGGRDERERERD